MAISNKLRNPTPFTRKVEYTSGITIKVPAEGFTLLTTQQMADFQDGRPGSEEARLKLTTQGLFLEDTDRSHDLQALEALRLCIKYLEGRYNEAVARLQDMHVAAGIDANIDSTAFRAKLRTMGLENLMTEVAKLKEYESAYVEEVGPQVSFKTQAPKYDPDRTCFVTDPPREFPTKAALRIFLNNNPEIRVKHESMTSRQVKE